MAWTSEEINLYRRELCLEQRSIERRYRKHPMSALYNRWHELDEKIRILIYIQSVTRNVQDKP